MSDKEPVFIPYPVERTEYVTREVNITEKRAPTDESVRLLKELEEKAQAKAVEAIHVGDASFECVVHMERDFASDCTWLRAIFSLNGKREVASVSYRPRQPKDDIEAASSLRDEVAKVIANRMISETFAKMQWKR